MHLRPAQVGGGFKEKRIFTSVNPRNSLYSFEGSWGKRRGPKVSSKNQVRIHLNRETKTRHPTPVNRPSNTTYLVLGYKVSISGILFLSFDPNLNTVDCGASKEEEFGHWKAESEGGGVDGILILVAI